jgi:hypothetical protein
MIKMPEAETTTLTVTRETRNRLASLGTKDQTFDEIISALLDEHDKKMIEQGIEKGGDKHGN